MIKKNLENCRVGEYVLRNIVGHGSFSQIWYAVHNTWKERCVAAKIPTDSKYINMLQNEAETMKLSHPGIAKIFGADPYGDPPYLLFEYVPGTTLRELVGKVSISDAIKIMKQVLSALKHAHEMGIIHRDIKPENILIHQDAKNLGYEHPGMVKLTDFGLGSSSNVTTSIVMSMQSISKEIAGTIAYMSPEAQSGTFNEKSDIYSCGIVLFELITGKRPVGNVSLNSFIKNVPHHLNEAFNRVYTHVDSRFNSAADFYNALEQPSEPIKPNKQISKSNNQNMSMALETDGGRRALAQSMVEPIRRSLEYQAADYSKDLRKAAESGNLEVVKVLLPHSDAKANNSQALRYAALNGHLEVVKVLLPHSDAKANNSEALRWAAYNGHLKVVKLLLPHSDPKANNSYALRWAAQNGHQEIVKLLLPHSSAKSDNSVALKWANDDIGDESYARDNIGDESYARDDIGDESYARDNI